MATIEKKNLAKISKKMKAEIRKNQIEEMKLIGEANLAKLLEMESNLNDISAMADITKKIIRLRRLELCIEPKFTFNVTKGGLLRIFIHWVGDNGKNIYKKSPSIGRAEDFNMQWKNPDPKAIEIAKHRARIEAIKLYVKAYGNFEFYVK